jgi:hypothetical protein
MTDHDHAAEEALDEPAPPSLGRRRPYTEVEVAASGSSAADPYGQVVIPRVPWSNRTSSSRPASSRHRALPDALERLAELFGPGPSWCAREPAPASSR